MDFLKNFCQTFGLHPLVGFGMLAVDWMLFGAEASTLGVGWLISIPVSLVLSIACIFIQKFAFKDDLGSAIGKSLLIGLLTAIPTAIPSVVSLAGGAIGTINLLLPQKDNE